MSQEGTAYNIIYTDEINGAKTLSFSIPKTIDSDGERVENFRVQYIKNEYLVRYQEDDITEWFIINLPEWSHVESATLDVTCGHISSLLNRRKLYLLLDDTNGIGTLPTLAGLILQDSGWDVGVCDVFLEADGMTEKIRSLKSDGKEGAYQLVTNLCNLFHARPVYHGDTKTVDFRAINNKEQMLEFSLQPTHH